MQYINKAKEIAFRPWRQGRYIPSKFRISIKY